MCRFQESWVYMSTSDLKHIIHISLKKFVAWWQRGPGFKSINQTGAFLCACVGSLWVFWHPTTCFCVFLLLLRFNVQSCDYSVKFPPHMVAHHFQDDKVKAGVEEDQREEIIRDLWGSHSNNQGLKSLRNPVRQILWLPSNKIHQMLCYLWKQSTSLLLK